MKSILKIIAIIVAVLLVAALVLPFVIDVNSFRPRIESEATAALGRQVTVGHLGLSILSGSVSAEDMTVADDPVFSKDPFIRAKSLEVGVELIPLIFSKSLHVTNITLDKPEITLLHTPAGKWNFSSLGAKSAKNPAASTGSSSSSSGSSAPPDLSIAKIKVKDGRVSVNEAHSSRPPHVYDNVSIEVKDFSPTSQFPFTLSAGLPGGGTLALDGKAGPINASDTSSTPLHAKLNVKKLDLSKSGFVDPASGISGIADFDGNLSSDGRLVHTKGVLNANQLKLSPKGAPAGRPVQLTYAVEHDLQKQSGTLTQGDVVIGKALAKLTGGYQMRGESTLLNMKLDAQNMPVDDLQAMLPALGVVLPSGSSLKGGTLSAALAIAGNSANPVITGPIRLANTQLAGFNLGSKLSAISALSGAKTGSDTSIQNFSTDAHVAPEGIRTDNVNLTIPALGVITGAGTINPGGALNYKMNAALSGSAVSGVTQMVGMSSKGAGIPFFIQGTTSDPKFVPDVQGMVGSQLKSRLGLDNSKGQTSPVNALTGLFGKKKKKQ
jgi:AsmA protein